MTTKPRSALYKVFGEQDSKGAGTLGRQEFKQALSQIFTGISDSQVHRVLVSILGTDHPAADPSHPVRYNDFVNAAAQRINDKELRPPTPPADPELHLKVQGKVHYRKALEARGGRKVRSAAEALHVLQDKSMVSGAGALFEMFNTDRDGAISTEEFKAGFAKLHLGVSDTHLEELLEYLDEDKNGFVTRAELIGGVSAATAGSLRQIDRHVPTERNSPHGRRRQSAASQPYVRLTPHQKQELSRQVVASGKSDYLPQGTAAISKLFRSLDRSSNGWISVQQLHRYLNAKRFEGKAGSLTAEDVVGIAAMCDDNADGRISLPIMLQAMHQLTDERLVRDMDQRGAAGRAAVAAATAGHIGLDDGSSVSTMMSGASFPRPPTADDGVSTRCSDYDGISVTGSMLSHSGVSVAVRVEASSDSEYGSATVSERRMSMFDLPPRTMGDGGSAVPTITVRGGATQTAKLDFGAMERKQHNQKTRFGASPRTSSNPLQMASNAAGYLDPADRFRTMQQALRQHGSSAREQLSSVVARRAIASARATRARVREDRAVQARMREEKRRSDLHQMRVEKGVALGMALKDRADNNVSDVPSKRKPISRSHLEGEWAMSGFVGQPKVPSRPAGIKRVWGPSTGGTRSRRVTN